MGKGSNYVPPAPRTKTCVGCGEKFVSRSNRGRYCKNACGGMFRKHGSAPKRTGRKCITCSVPIPETANLHTKFCGEDCRPATRPSGRTQTLPKKLRTRTAVCAYCGKRFTTTKTLQRFCSKWCSDTGVRCISAEQVYALRLGRNCLRCGVGIPIKSRVDKKFCSATCQVCFNQEMRRARKRGLPVEKISRAEVFERDNYTCHICQRLIEDGPVIDHLIPLALPDSPGHVWANVAAAHAFCNSSKCARVRPEDYELYLRLKQGTAPVR